MRLAGSALGEGRSACCRQATQGSAPGGAGFSRPRAANSWNEHTWSREPRPRMSCVGEEGVQWDDVGISSASRATPAPLSDSPSTHVCAGSSAQTNLQSLCGDAGGCAPVHHCLDARQRHLGRGQGAIRHGDWAEGCCAAAPWQQDITARAFMSALASTGSLSAATNTIDDSAVSGSV